MSTTFINGIKLPTGFILEGDTPIDDRMVVPTYSDLDTIERKYDGLLSYVQFDKTVYTYDEPSDTWIPIGRGENESTRLISIGSIIQNTSLLILNDILWRINGVDYGLPYYDTIITPANANNYRIDILVADATESITKIEGIEDTVNPVQPALPPNTVLVTTINVFEDFYETEVPNIDDYLLKSSEAQQPLAHVGIAQNFSWTNKNTYRWRATGSSSLEIHSLVPFAATNNNMYDGRLFTIINNGDPNTRLRLVNQSTTATGTFKFFIQNLPINGNLELKPGENAVFKYSIVAQQMELISTSSTSYGIPSLQMVSNVGSTATITTGEFLLSRTKPNFISSANVKDQENSLAVTYEATPGTPTVKGTIRNLIFSSGGGFGVNSFLQTSSVNGLAEVITASTNTYEQSTFRVRTLTGGGKISGIEINTNTGYKVSDQIKLKGLIYEDNYTALQLVDDRAITDVGGVKQLITTNDVVLKSYIDAQDALKVDLTDVGVTVASLDMNGKVPLSQINDSLLGNVTYKGLYDGTIITASPDTGLVGQPLPAASNANKGWYFIATTTFTNGSNSYSTGDWIISNGTQWDKVDNTDAVSSVNGMVGVVTITKATIGLGNVDNTSDLNKPISTATQTALDLKAPINNASMTGTFTLPNNALTITGGSVNNILQGNGVPTNAATLVRNIIISTNNGVATTIVANSTNFNNAVWQLQNQVDLRATLASPNFTGTPTAPTATAGTNTTQIATTAFVTTAFGNKVTKGGDTDGANLVLGTNDAFNVIVRVGGVAKMTFDTSTGIIVPPNTEFSATGTLSGIRFGSNSVTTRAEPTGSAAANRFTKTGTGTGDIAQFGGGAAGTINYAGVRNDGRVYGIAGVVSSDLVTMAQLATKIELGTDNQVAGLLKVSYMTEAQYAAITPDVNTSYFIQEVIPTKIVDLNTNASNYPLVNVSKLVYITFTGTTSIFTLPPVLNGKMVRFYIFNQGTGNITVNSNTGGNDIWDGGPTGMNTYTILAGSNGAFYNNGTYFTVVAA